MLNKYNKGFTLLELMISLALGLLISAAAIQLFTNSLVSTRIHQASAELQDSGIIGLDFVARDIRLANHGNFNRPALNEQTVWGGIVLTRGESTANVNLPINIIANELLSHSANADWAGASNVTVGGDDAVSDQLTIQFVAPENMVNCEGRLVQAGDYVIQRYFLRPIAAGSTDLALACDANTPTADGVDAIARPTVLAGFGGDGEIIIPRVDHLRFHLGIWGEDKGLAYYSIQEYRDLLTEFREANADAIAKAEADSTAAGVTISPVLLEIPRVVSVKISALVRSTDNTQNPNLDLSQPIQMFGETVLPSDQTTRFARRSYITTAAIRNAMGEPL